MTSMKELEIKINPGYANLVNPLSEEEYNSVRQSIKENGQYYPIIVNQDGIILGGHHRYKICRELGTKVDYKVLNFEDNLREKLFVFESNLQRRQLNSFQKSQLVLKMKPILEKIAKQNMALAGKGDKYLTPLGRVDEEIAKRAGVSRETVRKVEKIIECVPAEHLDAVRSGEISINQAHWIILLTEQGKKAVQDFCSDFNRLDSEMDKIDFEMKKLQGLLTDSVMQKEENRLKRKELGKIYRCKLLEHNKKDSELRILLLKMAAHAAFLVAPSHSKLEYKALKMFENLKELAHYESMLDERKARARDKKGKGKSMDKKESSDVLGEHQ
jgi:ParB-like chromosome segregation protein Spo0J